MTWIFITYISWGSVTDSNYLASTFIFFVRKLIGLIWKTWIWHDWTTLKTPKMSAVSIWKKLNSDFFHVTDFLSPCNISKIIVRPVFYLFLLQRLSSISNWTFLRIIIESIFKKFRSICLKSSLSFDSQFKKHFPRIVLF